MSVVRTGLDNFLASPPTWVAGKKLGLLCNPASIDRRYRHARLLIDRKFPGQLTALFTPQHGFFAEKQDNMIESEGRMDHALNIPVFSLYGKTRWPAPGMLDNIDVLVIDLQDVGTRVYTFIYTMAYAMEKAGNHGIEVVVLDRPNPINGIDVEGNVLSRACRSFVGRYPIPMRHGMTIGETAKLINEGFGVGCRLTVVPMSGWKRGMVFSKTKLPWIPPSPNLPTPMSAMVYPGQVLWEGTNVSEGRGTTQPFEIFGAPFFVPEDIYGIVEKSSLEGICLREIGFEPTSGKWEGSLCRGFQVHVTNPKHYQPYRTSLTLLWAVIHRHDRSFEWKAPPYEYEYEKRPIDLITGDREIRKALVAGTHPSELIRAWQPELNRFVELRGKFLLY